MVGDLDGELQGWWFQTSEGGRAKGGKQRAKDDERCWETEDCSWDVE